MKFFNASQEQYLRFRFKEHLTERGNNREMTVPMHIHSSAEILYVTKGEIKITVAGREPEYIRDGQAALLFPYQPHEYLRRDYTEYSRYNFQSSLANGFFAKNRTKVGKSAVFTVDEEGIKSGLNTLFLRKPFSELKAKSFIYSLLADFEAQVETCERTGDDDLFSRAIEYMNEHAANDISLSTVSKELGCCDRYLSRAIKTVAGVSFKRLLAMQRVDLALALLADSDKTLIEISMDCGFGSERNFYRVFKGITGFTPKEYRNERGFGASVDNIIF